MPNVQEQWKDWYSGPSDPPNNIANIGNFWLNTLTKGVWEKTGLFVWTLRGYLGDPDSACGLKQFAFRASDWDGNRLTLIPLGVPVHGQIGPHLIPPRTLWPQIQHDLAGNRRDPGVSFYFDRNTGYVDIYRAGGVPAFDGILGIVFPLAPGAL